MQVNAYPKISTQMQQQVTQIKSGLFRAQGKQQSAEERGAQAMRALVSVKTKSKSKSVGGNLDISV